MLAYIIFISIPNNYLNTKRKRVRLSVKYNNIGYEYNLETAWKYTAFKIISLTIFIGSLRKVISNYDCMF